MAQTNPVELTADLIRCASVTPNEGGALVVLERHLAAAGFACTRVDRGKVSNLYARWGAKTAARSFGFMAILMWCRSAHWMSGRSIRLAQNKKMVCYTGVVRRI